MGSEEVPPFLNNLVATPAIVDDHGDIFQCGKCKLQYTSLVDFLSHKREHAPANIEQIQSQLVLDNEQVEMVTFGEPTDHNIWVWNNVTVTDSNEIVIPAHHTTNKIVAENEKCIDYDSSLNIDQNINKFHNANDEEGYITTISQKMPPQNSTKTVADLVSCSECNRTFKQQFDLFQHFRTHTGEKPFQCIICGRTFSQKSNLKSHMLSHKVWPESLGKLLPEQNFHISGQNCLYCSKLFPNYPSLKVHLRQHNDRKMYQCIQKKCFSKFADLDLLLSHIKDCHAIAEYHCHMCNFNISSLEEISAHYYTHKNISKSKKKHSKHTCIYCKAVFKRFQHLSHHLATASHVNSCPNCNKTFVSERALRCHLKLHDNTKNYRCDICSVSFRRKNYLVSHLLTHSKEKLHVCLICSKKFARKDILMRHVKIHQDFQKKQCPFRSSMGCMMEYTRNDKLKLHIKSHTEKHLSKRKRKIVVEEELNKEQSTIEIIIVPLIGEASINIEKNSTPSL